MKVYQYSFKSYNNIMKQLTNKLPLCYMFQNANLVNSLAFIDQNQEDKISRTKILYLIKTEQENMQKQSTMYIQDLPLPHLNFSDSLQFQQQVQRVEAKLARLQQEKIEGKNKKKESTIPQLPKKITTAQYPQVSKLVETGVLQYQNSLLKKVNIQIYKKLGPLVLKQIIEILDKKKSNLSLTIQSTQNQINQINQNRKYQQAQAFQRENDMTQRIKIMLRKKKKIE